MSHYYIAAMWWYSGIDTTSQILYICSSINQCGLIESAYSPLHRPKLLMHRNRCCHGQHMQVILAPGEILRSGVFMLTAPYMFASPNTYQLEAMEPSYNLCAECGMKGTTFTASRYLLCRVRRTIHKSFASNN